MNKAVCFISLLSVTLFAIGISGCNKMRTMENTRTISFDQGWKFIKDNPSSAENPDFDDSNWRTVDLPHDWSIEDLPDQKDGNVIGPFSKASIGKMYTGYTIGGTAWYRKNFIIDIADKEKMAFLQFDGIYMNADVWINGKYVGNHVYGYTSFYYDITPYLNPAGQPNVVAVQVKNEGKNTRWYSGSGIYRHTWLTLVNPVHIGIWGIYVTTPVATDKSAEVNIATTLVNSGREDASVTLQIQLMDSTGEIVGTTNGKSAVAPEQSADMKQTITLENPSLWSIEEPTLYKALVTVLINNEEVDRVETTFGIRSIKFDAATGFTLNGKSMELKGGCYHHDNGPLGSAAIDRAEERKIELLKKAGFNAIRCSHNPPSPYLLDVCDRLGMLVINEFVDMWEKAKISPDDYSKYFRACWKQDLSYMVVRDRNHPSVIMWSIGNEILEAADTSGLRIAKNLSAEVRKLDPTRGITEAMVDFAAFMTGQSGWDKQAPHMAVLDAVGYNYNYALYEQDHSKYTARVIFGSETLPPRALEDWQMVEKLPYVIGCFKWTAMDYLGEAGVGLPRLIDIPTDKPGAGLNPVATTMQFFSPDSWPIFNNFQGDLDLIGNPKTPYYYQKVVWRESKVEMFVHRPVPIGKMENISPWGFADELKSWNWDGHEGEKMQVHVYTRSPFVKLELNEKIIGEQIIDETKSITATFEVPYEPGSLTARCYNNGVEMASETIKTVGKPAAIRLSADRSTIKADRNDLCYVMAEIIDTDGNVIPNADSVLVNFEIRGNGTIAGVGSGSPTDMSSFQQPSKKTWQGRCLVIVRPEVTQGKIVIKAKSEGLKEYSLEIVAE